MNKAQKCFLVFCLILCCNKILILCCNKIDVLKAFSVILQMKTTYFLSNSFDRGIEVYVADRFKVLRNTLSNKRAAGVFLTHLQHETHRSVLDVIKHELQVY